MKNIKIRPSNFNFNFNLDFQFNSWFEFLASETNWKKNVSVDFNRKKKLIFLVPYKYYQIFQWINSLFYLFSTNWKLWQREQASPELVHRRESKPLLNWPIVEMNSSAPLIRPWNKERARSIWTRRDGNFFFVSISLNMKLQC